MDAQARPITVLIVDDHLMVRYGLKALLALAPDLAVIGEAADGEEAFARCHEQRPDVILMDIVMPIMDGPTATARIRAAFPQIQVIALTSFADETLVPRALQAGAISYLLKDVHADQLATAIRATASGRATLAPAAVEALAHLAAAPPAPHPELTRRERDVLALLMAGESNIAIAAHLGISHGEDAYLDGQGAVHMHHIALDRACSAPIPAAPLAPAPPDGGTALAARRSRPRATTGQ